MKILQIVGGLPTTELPFFQPFTKSQIDSLIEEGIDIEILNIKGYESALNYITCAFKIKQIVQSKQIELIHAHYGYSGLTALLGRTKIPVILSLLGSDLLGGTPNANSKAKIKEKLEKLITIQVAKRVDRIIVKSKRMKEKIFLNKPIDVIPNGVNFDIFHPKNKLETRKKLELEADKFIVLFLGNPNSKNKNINLAKSGFDKFVTQFDISDSQFINPYGISQTRVVEYMNASDVILLTSFWEGSPNVIKESMACNLPIISVDVGDAPEVIKDANNCFVVDYSEEQIAEKLKIIYDNKLPSNGREKIAHLDSSIIAKKIICIYEETINKLR